MAYTAFRLVQLPAVFLCFSVETRFFQVCLLGPPYSAALELRPRLLPMFLSLAVGLPWSLSSPNDNGTGRSPGSCP